MSGWQWLIKQHFAVCPLNSSNATPVADLRLLNDKIISMKLDL